MKNLATALYSKLSGSDFFSNIGGRVYKDDAPDGTDYPYAVFMLISDVPEYTFSEQYESVQIQFSIFSNASGSTEIEDLYTNLKSLYDECSLSITSSALIWMRRQNATLMMEEHTTPSGIQRVRHYAVDYEIYTSLD